MTITEIIKAEIAKANMTAQLGQIPTDWAGDAARRVQSALAAHGYVIVPSEPTEAMISAAECTGIEWGDGDAHGVDYDLEYVYRAMLAAHKDG